MAQHGHNLKTVPAALFQAGAHELGTDPLVLKGGEDCQRSQSDDKPVRRLIFDGHGTAKDMADDLAAVESHQRNEVFLAGSQRIYQFGFGGTPESLLVDLVYGRGILRRFPADVYQLFSFG
jgi:hypothetical protein